MVVTIALGAVLAAVPAVDGRSLGASLTHAIVCTAANTAPSAMVTTMTRATHSTLALPRSELMRPR